MKYKMFGIYHTNNTLSLGIRKWKTGKEMCSKEWRHQGGDQILSKSQWQRTKSIFRKLIQRLIVPFLCF